MSSLQLQLLPSAIINSRYRWVGPALFYRAPKPLRPPLAEGLAESRVRLVSRQQRWESDQRGCQPAHVPNLPAPVSHSMNIWCGRNKTNAVNWKSVTAWRCSDAQNAQLARATPPKNKNINKQTNNHSKRKNRGGEQRLQGGKVKGMWAREFVRRGEISGSETSLSMGGKWQNNGQEGSHILETQNTSTFFFPFRCVSSI